MKPPDAMVREVEQLRARGVEVEIVSLGAQCYVLARQIEAPSRTWDRAGYDILIAVPAAYDDAGLDAFYLGIPYSYKGNQHERVNGDEITVGDRKWKLVSWHYADGKEWMRGVDCLETHLVHCKGFFFGRGVHS